MGYDGEINFSYWGSGGNNSGPQAGDILVAARTHLNDDEGIIWPDQKLFPKLREAHRQLQLALVANGVPIVREVSAIFKVPAGTKDLTVLPAYPDDLVQPIWLKERAPGQTDRDFIDMAEVDFLPQVLVDRRLIYWCWTGQKIMTISSYADREVMIRYKKALKIPQEATDNVGPFFGEIYLSYKTAALAVGSITPRDENKLEFLTLQADSSLEDLLKLAAMSAQNLPTKRRPYHRGRGRGRVIRAI